jgi:hypothetical protein
MKANKLMIGDVVSVNYTPLQITALGTAKAGFLDARGEMFYHYYDNIVPIPLTREILKANGINIEVAPYTPNWIRCILNPNFFLEDRLKGFYHFNGNNLAKMQYVHELQHALRLCGIEKEIQL